MKVLLLPVNTASEISHKVRALRRLGVDARGLTISGNQFQATDNIKTLPRRTENEGFTTRLKWNFFYLQIWRLILWADVVHWFSDAQFLSNPKHEKFMRLANKPGVVQWGGSEIRVPEIESVINPYYRQAFKEGYEYPDESRERSYSNQKYFASLNFYPLEFIGMGHYIDRELFPRRFRVWQSIVLQDHPPRYPDVRLKRPFLLHSPTAPVAKGTEYVVRAVERLKTKYDFDFTLLSGVTRSEALQMMSRCDIYIDQLILGAHGAAAVEAMAFGKPVVCYINPETERDYPPELPIVNANPDNIEEKLEILIRDSILRRETGEKSRAYVEKYHDDQKIARELVEIYREVIELRKIQSRKK